MEIASGIHRIESDLGPRFMCQYALIGDERVLVVDTGLAETPMQVLVPYLEQVGAEPDFVLISHADVDHCGGDRSMRERYPQALLMCHELDRRWIESNATLLNENYLWHEPHGFDEPDEEARRQILADCGDDTPIDVEPELLLTAHYPVMARDEARAWLDEALAFTERLEALVRQAVAGGTTDLWELTKLANDRLGPYPEWTTELGASVRAHLAAS